MSGFSTTDASRVLDDLLVLSLAALLVLLPGALLLLLSLPPGGKGGAKRTSGGGPGTMRKRHVSVQLQADPCNCPTFGIPSMMEKPMAPA